MSKKSNNKNRSRSNGNETSSLRNARTVTASPAAAYTGKQTPVQTPAQTPAGAPVALSLDQRRAAFALACVQQVDSAFPLPANGDEDDAKRSVARGYRAYSRNLPSTIIVNGLGQAIALELAQSARNQKDSEGHGLLLDHVTAWLVAKGGWGVSSPYHGGAKADRKGQYRKPELIAAIVSGSDFDLVRAQIETMAFLKWLKTFAEALIESRDPKGNEDADTTGTLEDAP